MSGLTGYLTSGGIDLSYIFQNGTSPTITTGFLLQNGLDIATTFAPYTSRTASTTGLINISGNDLNTLFNGITPIPLQITGCCLWMDAADSSTVTITSSKVSGWTDKSGRGYNFNQNTTGNRPAYTTNSQNGLATLAFNSTDSTYLIGNAAATGFALGQNSYSLFVVCKTNDTTSSCSIYCKSIAAPGTNRIYITRDSATTNLNVLFVNNDSSYLASTVDSYTANTFRIIELVLNRKSASSSNNSETSYQNGNVLSTRTIANTYNYSASSYLMLIGAYNNSSDGLLPPYSGYYLTGNVAEIVSYSNSTNMTATTRQRIEGYLAWKWGIQSNTVHNLPSGHPYYSAAPNV